MSVISLYTTNPKIQASLTDLLDQLDQEGPEPVRTEGFTSFSAFLDSGRRNPRRILLLAQEGTKGVELAAAAAEECLESPLVWFSDLDFALFSYRLEVDHFALLPGTAENLRAALRSCGRRHKARAAPLPAEKAALFRAEPPPRSLRQRLWERWKSLWDRHQ